MTLQELIWFASRHTDQIICAAFIVIGIYFLINKAALPIIHAAVFTLFTALDWYVLDLDPQVWSVTWGLYFFCYFLFLNKLTVKILPLKISVLLCSIVLLCQPVFYFSGLHTLDDLHNEYFYHIWYSVIAIMFLGVVNGGRVSHSAKGDRVSNNDRGFSRFFRISATSFKRVKRI